jgi:LysM repeat protein
MIQTRSSLKILFLLIFTALLMSNGFADAQVPVSKSTVIEQYNGSSFYLHTVQAKQTLYSISKAYNIDIARIEAANPDTKNGLRVNQVIRIPAGNAVPTRNRPAQNTNPASAAQNDEESLPDIVRDYETIYHVAGRNETFTYIADIYLVPVNNIRLANPGMKEPVTEGEYVLVPIAPKEKRPPVINEQRFQRTAFDPFNPPAKENATIKAAEATASAGATSKPVIAEPSNRPNQNQTQDDSRQPRMVEPFTVPETSNVAADSPEKSQKPKVAGTQYVVKPGETLFSISRKNLLTIDALVEANPGISNGVKAGQVLLIPPTLSQPEQVIQSAKQDDSTIIHTVKAGETLYRISRNYAVSIDEMKRLNPGLTTTIKPGQQIVLPKKKITEPFVLYEVDSRQRTKKLARNFDLDADELYELNPGIGRRVFAGQLLKIPLLDHIEVAPVQPEPIETPENIEAKDTEPAAEIPFADSDCAKGKDYSAHEFKIALLLPLQLQDVDTLLAQYTSGSDPELILTENAFSFTSFYRGFMLAADSMARSQGMNLVVKTFDVDQTAQKAYDAIADPFLKDAHLIIGPLFSRAFDVVAPFALREQIPIVNPFAKRNEIVMNNPAVIKIKPAIQEQYAQLAELLKTRYNNAKVFLYQAHQYTNARELAELRETIRTVVPDQVSVAARDILDVISERSRKMELDNALIPSITIEGETFYTSDLEANPFDTIFLPNHVKSMVYSVDSVRSFAAEASVLRENIVIALTDDKVFATEIVNKLNQVADTFSVTLIGLPEWEQFDQLFNENLMKMKAIYFTSNHLDYQDYFTQLFIHQYRQRYAYEPDRYAFEAFDIGWYFLNALHYLGPRPMPCLSQFQVPLLQTQLMLRSQTPKNGYENTYWNIYQYQHFKRETIPNTYFLNPSREL